MEDTASFFGLEPEWMTLDLESLPIVLDNQSVMTVDRRSKVTTASMTAAAAILLTILVSIPAHRVLFGAVVSLAALISLAAWIRLGAKTELLQPKKVVFGRGGIRVERSSGYIDYPWTDIVGATYFVLVRGRTPLAYVRIQRRGAIYGPEDTSDTISYEYGVDLRAIENLIKEGVAKWGSSS